MVDERNWFVGVDWASETHHVRVSDARGRKLGARAFAHSGEGLAAMAAWILELTGAAPEAVFVAIEVPHGPVVESLMERGFRVHAINPKQLDRFRDRFSPAGAKDDSRDVQVIVRNVRTSLVVRCPGLPIRTQATTVSWCTSSPAARSIITCMLAYVTTKAIAAGTLETLPRVLPVRQGRQRMVLCAARAGLAIAPWTAPKLSLGASGSNEPRKACYSFGWVPYRF